MFRYRLRTLLILLAIGPPVAVLWYTSEVWLTSTVLAIVAVAVAVTVVRYCMDSRRDRRFLGSIATAETASMFRFTIRELILLTVVVATILGWLLNLKIERQHVTDLATKNKTLLQTNRALTNRNSQTVQLLQRASARADAAEKVAGTYVPPPNSD